MHVKHNGFMRDLATEQKKRQIWNIKMFKRKKKSFYTKKEQVCMEEVTDILKEGNM